MLNIDGKEYSFGRFGINQFSKADVRYAWDSYGEEKITFDKSGSEIKTIITSKKFSLEKEKEVCEAKMKAIEKEVNDSRSKAREGHTEVIDNYDYELPHDRTEKVTETTKQLVREYRVLERKHHSLDEDIKMCETLIKHLDDAKRYKLNLRQLHSIEKADIANEFPSYGHDALTFAKTGKEIKEKLQGRKAHYIAKKGLLETNMASALKELKEKGHDPSDSSDEGKVMVEGDDGMQYPTFNYRQFEKYGNESNSEFVDDEDVRKKMRAYNNMVWDLRGANRDLKVIEIMLSEMEDKKKYKLNIRQIAVIQKAGDAKEEIIKATKESASKVDKVMGEYKEGTLMSGSGKKVTDKKQALAIAMSEAGLSKSDFESIKKFLPAFTDYDYPESIKKDETEISKALDVLSGDVEDNDIEKGEVKGHYKTTASGKKVWVKPHSDIRAKKESGDKQAKTSFTTTGAAVQHLAKLSGVSQGALWGFSSKHNLDAEKMAQDIAKKKLSGVDVSTAVSGKEGNKYAKNIIGKYGQKKEDSVKKAFETLGL